MKLLLIFPNWLGRSGNYCQDAAIKLGYESHLVWGSDHEVLTVPGYIKDKIRRIPVLSHKFNVYENYHHNKTIINSVKRIKPEIVINNCPSLLAETVQILKENSSCMVYWAGDNPVLFPSLMKSLNQYDFFFSGAPNWLCDELLAFRRERNYYLPYGCNPDIFKPEVLSSSEKCQYGAEISFVGARYSDREGILASIIDFEPAIWGWKKDNFFRKFYRIIRGGYNCPIHDKYQINNELYIPALNNSIRKAYISNQIANKIYNGSSIVLNLQHPQMVRAVNSKAFEIAAAGGFQLFQHTENLLGLFKKDSEMVCFKDISELREQIEYFLRNPHERMVIANKARLRVLSDHTFTHRLEYIINIAGRS